MLFLTFLFAALGVADLVGGRRSPESKEVLRFWWARGLWGALAGAATATLIAAPAGLRFLSVCGTFVAVLLVLLVWTALWTSDPEKQKSVARLSLLWLISVLVLAAFISSLAPPVHGPLDEWYHGLDFRFVDGLPVGRFLLGAAAAIFSMATGNRIVRDALALTDVKTTEDQSPLKGGRFLGPMERLIVGAVILAGQPAAAAIVVTAKGPLRFPEIRGKGAGPDDSLEDDPSQGPDENTEYFLIGTFSSFIVAGALALLVSASG